MRGGVAVVARCNAIYLDISTGTSSHAPRSFERRFWFKSASHLVNSEDFLLLLSYLTAVLISVNCKNCTNVQAWIRAFKDRFVEFVVSCMWKRRAPKRDQLMNFDDVMFHLGNRGLEDCQYKLDFSY